MSGFSSLNMTKFSSDSILVLCEHYSITKSQEGEVENNIFLFLILNVNLH